MIRILKDSEEEEKYIYKEPEENFNFKSDFEAEIINFGKYYMLSENLTVDEQLMLCRPRCLFIQYMPSKPKKYGMKIWCVCDSKTGYPLMGKEGNTSPVDLLQNIVELIEISQWITTLPVLKWHKVYYRIVWHY